MLDERSRILGTLETLLAAVNHASTEQRAAIDGQRRQAEEDVEADDQQPFAHADAAAVKAE